MLRHLTWILSGMQLHHVASNTGAVGGAWDAGSFPVSAAGEKEPAQLLRLHCWLAWEPSHASHLAPQYSGVMPQGVTTAVSTD